MQQIATGGLYGASNIAALAKVPSAAGVGVGVIGGTEAGATATSLGSLSFAPTSQTVATPGLLSATVGLQSQGQGSAVGGMLDYGRWKQVLHIRSAWAMYVYVEGDYCKVCSYRILSQ